MFFWSSALLCCLADCSNPPWQVGVAFHSVRESKAPDQTRFWAPMDPREESVMSWNNIILPLPHWAIRFGLVYTRKKQFFWCENDLLRTFRVAHIEAKPLITATFSSDWAQEILTGLVGSAIEDRCITALNIQWIQQWDGMDEDDVKTQTRHELPEPKVCTEKHLKSWK